MSCHWKEWWMEFSGWFLLESFGAHVVIWHDWPSRKLSCIWKGLCLISQPVSHPVNAVLILSVLKIVSLVIEEFVQVLFCSFSSLGLRSEICAALWFHLAEKHWLSIIICRLDVLFGVWLCKSKSACSLWVWLPCFLLV